MKKRTHLSNSRGVALLVTLFAVMMMVFMAVEIGYNTRVELVVGAAQLDRLKAYYLAKTGVQLSMLRIYVFNQVIKKFGGQQGVNPSMFDVIWQFPLSWPPALPPEAGLVSQDSLKDTLSKSFIDGSFATSIEGEGRKIDLNDLVSPVEAIRKAINAQLVQLIQNRLDADDEWARKHRDVVRPQEIINNITDWMDPDLDSLNGGSELSGYANTDPPISPANRSLKTVDELHMIAGVTDEVFNILGPRVTIYGHGIDVNMASEEVLRSLDKQITKEVTKQIITRRSDPDKGRKRF
jgi:general secretion pathway protein K